MLAQRYRPEVVLAELQRTDVWWELAILKKRPVGFSSCQLADAPGELKLDKLYVHPQHQGAGVGTGSRAMKFGTSYLPYEVYSDAAMTTAYPTAATSLGVVLPGTGAAVGLPVFGRINKTSGNALQPGTYTDVLQVTLAW